MTRNLDTISTGLADGLGTLVWWDLHNTLITPTNLRAILDANGFDPASVPDIDPAKAVRDAVARWKVNGFQTEWLGKNDQGHLVMGLLERVRDENANRVDRLQRVRITFDPTAVIFDTSSPAPLTDTVQGALDAFLAYANRRCLMLDHNWIRPKFLKAQLSQLASFLVKSGMYYVPTAHNDTVLRIQQVIEGIGCSHLFIMEVPDTDQARRSVGSSAHAAILTEVQEAVEKLADWRKRMTEAGARKVRSTARANLLTSFVELRDRAQLYASALRFEILDIEALIADTEAQAGEFFAALDADDPAPAGSDALTEEAAPTETPVEPTPEPAPEPQAAPHPDPRIGTGSAMEIPETTKIGTMKKPALLALAKSLNIRGRGRMKLDELRCAIIANQEARG